MSKTYSTPTLVAVGSAVAITQASIAGCDDPANPTELRVSTVGAVGFWL